jgi:hypothetical protein
MSERVNEAVFTSLTRIPFLGIIVSSFEKGFLFVLVSGA